MSPLAYEYSGVNNAAIDTRISNVDIAISAHYGIDVSIQKIRR